MSNRITFEQLIETIGSLPYGSIFKIEGCCEAGKSTLADELARVTITGVVHVDQYLLDPEGVAESVQYADRVDYRALEAAIVKARSNANGMIIEGICLHLVLSRLNLGFDEAVYVKRISSAGIWHDGMHIEDFSRGKVKLPREPDLSDMRYHITHTPHLVIEHSYLRVET